MTTHKRIIIIVLICVTSLLSLPSIGAEAQKPETLTASSGYSDAVNKYERHQTFRGTDNEALPATPAQGFQLGSVMVSPPISAAGVTSDGFVDYGELQPGAVLVAASDGPGKDRFAVVITEIGDGVFHFPASTPPGASVEHTDAGTIEITSMDGSLTTLAPALAVDANGALLKAEYKLANDAMTIYVDLTEAAYPVFVDPVSSYYWWGHQTWLSINDVRRQASWWGIGKVIKQACNRSWGAAKWACKRTAGRYISWVLGNFNYAKANGHCLWYKQAWTGQIWSIGTYRCDWH